MFAVFFNPNVMDGDTAHKIKYNSYKAEMMTTVDFPDLVAQDNNASLYLLQNGAGYISCKVCSQIGNIVSEYNVPKK